MKLGTCTPQFCSNHGDIILLNFLSLNNVFGSGKRKKLHRVSRTPFSPPLQACGMYWHNFLSTSHPARRAHIWWKSTTPSNCLSKCSDLIQINSQHASAFTERFFCFRYKFLHSICFASWLMSWEFGIFSSDHSAFELVILKKLAFFPLPDLQKLLLIFQKFQ